MSAAQALLSGSPFKLSDKPYDWLGSGSYFWEWDILRAYEWAVQWRSKDPCVVGAVIELGNCLDLTTRKGAEAVMEAHTTYLELMRITGSPVRENKKAKTDEAGDVTLRFLDREVMEHLHASYKIVSKKTNGSVKEFDTVRALFPEGKELYPGAGFWDKTHVQIAVKEVAQIRGVFRVPIRELKALNIPDVYRF
ncbi:hypothetical protein [Granulicella rosea]|uniref:hypothetical protein n=1 Tax=Granulicella rosea TaxID=474952 RepID=UPI001C3CEE6C|nr:hypothetical protein [Granulicella rosea]